MATGASPPTLLLRNGEGVNPHQLIVPNPKLTKLIPPFPPQEEIENPPLPQTTYVGNIKINLPPIRKASYAAKLLGRSPSSSEEDKATSTKPSSTIESSLTRFAKGLLQLKPQSLHQGKPLVTFKQSDKQQLIARLHHIVIAKFSHGRPSLFVIKQFLLDLKLQGDYVVSIYDSKHVFIECLLFADFTKLWLKKSWVINGYQARFFKWSEAFQPSKESNIVPVWIHLPGLPVYFYEEEALLSIANSIGKPLHIDLKNLNRTKLDYASICVEFDVSKPLTDEIWIEFEADNSHCARTCFRQKIVYDATPPYCFGCYHLGHSLEVCKSRLTAGAVVNKHGVEELNRRRDLDTQNRVTESQVRRDRSIVDKVDRNQELQQEASFEKVTAPVAGETDFGEATAGESTTVLVFPGGIAGQSATQVAAGEAIAAVGDTASGVNTGMIFLGVPTENAAGYHIDTALDLQGDLAPRSQETAGPMAADYQETAGEPSVQQESGFQYVELPNRSTLLECHGVNAEKTPARKTAGYAATIGERVAAGNITVGDSVAEREPPAQFSAAGNAATGGQFSAEMISAAESVTADGTTEVYTVVRAGNAVVREGNDTGMGADVQSDQNLHISEAHGGLTFKDRCCSAGMVELDIREAALRKGSVTQVEDVKGMRQLDCMLVKSMIQGANSNSHTTSDSGDVQVCTAAGTAQMGCHGFTPAGELLGDGTATSGHPVHAVQQVLGASKQVQTQPTTGLLGASGAGMHYCSVEENAASYQNTAAGGAQYVLMEPFPKKTTRARTNETVGMVEEYESPLAPKKLEAYITSPSSWADQMEEQADIADLDAGETAHHIEAAFLVEKEVLMAEEEKAEEEEKEEQIRIVSQLSPSEVKDYAKKEMEKIWNPPTRVAQVLDTSTSNPYILDKEGRPAPCSEVIRKSMRLAVVRSYVEKVKQGNTSPALKEKAATLKEKWLYDKLMNMYTEQIHLTIKDHQQTISSKDTSLRQEMITHDSADEKD